MQPSKRSFTRKPATKKPSKKETTMTDLYEAYIKGMKMMSGTKAFEDNQKKIHKMRKDLKMNE